MKSLSIALLALAFLGGCTPEPRPVIEVPPEPADNQSSPSSQKLDGVKVGDVFWVTDFNGAMKLATKENKPMFVDFMATWCGPCKELEKDVFEKADFQQFKDKYIFVRVDIDKNEDAARLFGVDAIPDVRIISGTGRVVKGFKGNHPLNDVLYFMKD